MVLNGIFSVSLSAIVDAAGNKEKEAKKKKKKKTERGESEERERKRETVQQQLYSFKLRTL